MASIRHQISIAASTRDVWRALTTEEGVTSWWVDEARIDARNGGRIVLTSEGDDGEPVIERGMFHELRPTRRIEIRWDTAGDLPTAGSEISFSLARSGDETRLALLHRGGEAFEDEEQREVLDKGWRQALKALRDYLED